MIRLVRLPYLHFMHAKVLCCHCFKDNCGQRSYSLLMHMGLGLYTCPSTHRDVMEGRGGGERGVGGGKQGVVVMVIIIIDYFGEVFSPLYWASGSCG